MRVDGQNNAVLAFDNMQRRPLKGTFDWREAEVVLDVSSEATNIAFGVLLTGRGLVRLADLRSEVVGSRSP